MSYVNEVNLVQNDYGYDLEFQLSDASGNAVDLTGATAIKVFVAEPGKTTAKIVGDCTVVNATGGLCKYTVVSGDFDEAPKQYDVEIEVTYVGKVVTARGTVIKIISELPESKT